MRLLVAQPDPAAAAASALRSALGAALRRSAPLRRLLAMAAAGPDGLPERQLFPLTGFRIGLWKPRSAWSPYLLTLAASRRFVVLLVRQDTRKVRRGAACPGRQGAGGC